MTFYVWDETYTNEVSGAIVDAESREDAIRQLHNETVGEQHNLEDYEYEASTEKPEWWDKEES